MKVLCFSDLHRDAQAAQQLVSMASDADLVIGAGDFANRHEGLPDTLDVLCEIKTPSILVPGNGETVDELREAARKWTSAQVLHGNGSSLEVGESNVELWGVGGGIPVTPFGDWSYDFDEEQSAAMLEGCPAGGILVVHSPPIDTVDHDSAGRIRGSQSIRDCVQRCQPKLVVCGHIHSDWGKHFQLGNSLIINAGPKGQLVEL